MLVTLPVTKSLLVLTSVARVPSDDFKLSSPETMNGIFYHLVIYSHLLKGMNTQTVSCTCTLDLLDMFPVREQSITESTGSYQIKIEWNK
uniref:Uncharacterized protein n=1 Tax=Arundo donax TaxID=35708 RepID=A0A0A9D6R8_ARUDO